jgi:hypothetical protein
MAASSDLDLAMLQQCFELQQYDQLVKVTSAASFSSTHIHYLQSSACKHLPVSVAQRSCADSAFRMRCRIYVMVIAATIASQRYSAI